MTEDTHKDQPGLLTEGNAPERAPSNRDDAVVDAEFTGLDNDLIDMGQFDGVPNDDGLGPVDEDEDQPGLPDDHDIPGGQERPLTDDEKLEKSLEDTFPTSDPIQPSRIDGPNN
jgi:hypothetical protein